MHDREWKGILNVAQDLSHQEVTPDLSRQEIVQDLSYQEVVPDLSHQEIVQDLSRQEIVPNLSSHEIMQDLSYHEIINKIKRELEVKYPNIYGKWEDAEFNLDHQFPFQSKHIDNQCTLLYISAFHGARRAVNALLKNGANVNIKDEYGSTPLHRAILSGNADIVNALLEKGAKVNVRDKCGNTPLHHAAEDNRVDIVKALLRKGAKIDIEENIFGRNPLHWAALRGHINVVEILLKREGINIDSRDKFGKTSLHLVAERGHMNTVKVLLVAGAKVDLVENIFRRTPLHWAALRGNIGTVEMLLESGANPLIKDRHGYTARNLTLNDDVRQLLRKTEDKRFYKPITIGTVTGCLTAAFGIILAIWLIIKKDITINIRHVPLVFAAVAVVALVTGVMTYKLFAPKTRVNAIQVGRGNVVQGRN